MTTRITWFLIILITIGGVIAADSAIDGVIGWWHGKEMSGFQIFSLCYFSISALIILYAIMTAEPDPDDVINRDDENC
jgi:hypothetical protein